MKQKQDPEAIYRRYFHTQLYGQTLTKQELAEYETAAVKIGKRVALSAATVATLRTDRQSEQPLPA